MEVVEELSRYVVIADLPPSSLPVDSIWWSFDSALESLTEVPSAELPALRSLSSMSVPFDERK